MSAMLEITRLDINDINGDVDAASLPYSQPIRPESRAALPARRVMLEKDLPGETPSVCAISFVDCPFRHKAVI